MSFPQWVSLNPNYNLRQVAPNLYIGAELSPEYRPNGGDWGLVVDWYGSSRTPGRAKIYGSAKVLTLPFDDGLAFPAGTLDRAFEAVSRELIAGRPVLIHCQAGLSRSASSAYAMMRVLFGLTHTEALRRVKIRPDFPRRDTLASARAWVRMKKKHTRPILRS